MWFFPFFFWYLFILLIPLLPPLLYLPPLPLLPHPLSLLWKNILMCMGLGWFYTTYTNWSNLGSFSDLSSPSFNLRNGQLLLFNLVGSSWDDWELWLLILWIFLNLDLLTTLREATLLGFLNIYEKMLINLIDVVFKIKTSCGLVLVGSSTLLFILIYNPWGNPFTNIPLHIFTKKSSY